MPTSTSIGCHLVSNAWSITLLLAIGLMVRIDYLYTSIVRFLRYDALSSYHESNLPVVGLVYLNQ